MTPARTICIGFLAVITFGTFLLCLPISVSSSTWANPITALFTSTSAVCVTGLSVVDVGTYYTRWGQMFLLLLVQVGGLGYMTATTFLLALIGQRFTLRHRITLQQSLDTPGMRGVTQLVKSIIATTLLFELTGTFALIPVFNQQFDLGTSIWQSLFHSVSAFNNAGFSLFPDNLMGYVGSPVVNLVITVLIIFGGIGYQVIIEGYLWLRFKLWKQGNRISLSLNFRVAVSTTLVLLLVGTIAFICTESHNLSIYKSPPTFLDEFWAAWFQSVTTRTAGFNTVDISKITTTSLFVMVVLMFIGASPGGTGGGIKTTTLRLLTHCTVTTLQGREEVYLYKRQVPSALIFKAVGVVLGSMATVVTSTAILSITDRNIDFIKIFFEATSAFATVGLSTGITSSLSMLGQLVIIATMYIGRVGVLLLITALSKEPRPSLVKYPEENMLVG